MRLGYSGTETWPAIQIARSATIQCAQFLEMMAMRLPCGSSRLRNQLAARRACSPTSAQLSSSSWPPPEVAPCSVCSGALLHVHKTARAANGLHQPQGFLLCCFCRNQPSTCLVEYSTQTKEAQVKKCFSHGTFAPTGNKSGMRHLRRHKWRHRAKGQRGWISANSSISPAAGISPSSSARLAVRMGSGSWRCPCTSSPPSAPISG